MSIRDDQHLPPSPVAGEASASRSSASEDSSASSLASGSQTTYDELKDQAWAAIMAGRLKESLALYDGALAWARQHGEPWQADRTLCSRASVLVELGLGKQVHQDLRRVLLASTDPDSRFLAAYTLARAYEAAKDFDKAVFYARIAQRHAQDQDNAEWISSSHNQIGNLMLASSQFDAALPEFEAALAIAPNTPDVRRALALDNLGYCHVVQGRYRQGFRAHLRALRMLRRVGGRAWEPVVEVSLCFAYLEISRYRSAIRHALRALHLSEETDNDEMKKNSLFLLGESFKLAGDPLAARRHFTRLQAEFYPGAEGVTDLLLLLNVKRLINIKA